MYHMLCYKHKTINKDLINCALGQYLLKHCIFHPSCSQFLSRGEGGYRVKQFKQWEKEEETTEIEGNKTCWTLKMWYIHTMQYYSATKRTEVLVHAKTWINLKNVTLNQSITQKQSVTQKAIYFMILFVWNVHNRQIKSIKTESRLVLARGWVEEECGVTANRWGVSFLGRWSGISGDDCRTL